MDEALAALAASHERIEEQLNALERLTRSGDAEAARAVLRYFDGCGAQHHRDEDEDLFPLLRRLAAEHDRPDVAAIIGVLEREHGTMEQQWTRLRGQLHGLVNGGVVLDGEEVSRFAWLYRRHMDEEAAVVIPFAKERLTAAQWAALGHRMAARRVAAA